ncbi:ImmA/IrrE family metallo-endopeptidase [Streptomyces sp. B1866]|uniref:ImmA/IrrE family metallo-endopeptidase n=1 Tax=Streptomyces sp. B1866 TaxID=3075431 RepID=UPI00288CBDF3|nr:ImmA/IrrE family metallo-endopeptidase [Streptomyces sp. B1866]MDT3395920.1 ImmA/IrrE family metallo-endopeptidase [Streptomyces sp. B1866]
MVQRSLRKTCTRLIRGLDIPDPFDVGILCTRIAERRGRPIRRVPLGFPPGGPGGLLISTATADYVFYEAHTTATHQTHVIVHELGHLLLGHEPTSLSLPGPVRGLLPEDVSPTLVRHMLARSHYAQPEEYAAEYFATQVLREVSAWYHPAPAPGPAAPSGTAGLVGRLERSFQHGGGAR